MPKNTKGKNAEGFKSCLTLSRPARVQICDTKLYFEFDVLKKSRA